MPANGADDAADDVESTSSPRARELTGTGITLLGVLVSVGVTVGMGIEAVWWVRVLTGAVVTVLLIVGVKSATRTGRGMVARTARWVITSEDSQRDFSKRAP